MIDVLIEKHGTIVLVRPLTDAAKEWVTDNVPLESWQWMGDAFACEPRLVENLVTGMTDGGLKVA